MKTYLKIISGADSSHFLSLVQLILSYTLNRNKLPSSILELWDLGLTEYEVDFIKNYLSDDIVFAKFPYSEYPEWVNISRNAGEYAWKPIIIELSLQMTEQNDQAQFLLWMDSGNILNDRLNLLPAFLHENLIYSPVSSGTVSDWTHAGMLSYSGHQHWHRYETFTNFPCRNGAAYGFNITDPRIRLFIKTFRNLALDKSCIAPPGSSRSNHRQDQALFTLLYYEFILSNSLNVVNDYVGFSIHNDVDKQQITKVVEHFPHNITPQRKIYEIDQRCDFSVSALLKFYNFKITGVLIAGAHEGQEIESFAPSSPFFLIEPLPTLSHLLQRRYSSTPNIQISTCAISDTTGYEDFYVASNSGQSSSLKRPQKHLIYAPMVNFVDTERVEVKRLDSMLEPAHRFNFWILDVQGSELNALRGAGATLRSLDYLYVEVNRDFTYENCAIIDDMDEYLKSFGLYRVLTRWWNIWGDALYVRSNLKSRSDT